jgi:hypothetical protein
MTSLLMGLGFRSFINSPPPSVPQEPQALLTVHLVNSCTFRHFTLFFPDMLLAQGRLVTRGPCHRVFGIRLNKTASCQALVAHTCNPSYSGGRDEEDHGSKPAWANSSRDHILKKPITKKGWWSGSWCRPWVQTPVPQGGKKKKRESFSKAKIPGESQATIFVSGSW